MVNVFSPPVDEEKESVDENADEELTFSRTQETLDSIQKENYMLNIGKFVVFYKTLFDVTWLPLTLFSGS